MAKLSRFFLFLTFLLTVFVGANAQSLIPEQKRKVIADLMIAMKIEDQVMRGFDATMAGMSATYPIAVKTSLEKMPGLSSQERNEMEHRLVAKQRSFAEKYRSRFSEVVDLKHFLEETYVPLYDKYYTEAELRDMLAFYNSPTGKKVLEVAQPMGTEAIKITVEQLTPKLVKLSEDIINEEVNSALPPVKKDH